MSNDRYQEIRDALAMGPTPGPWVAIQNPDWPNAKYGITHDPSKDWVEAVNSGVASVNGEANARLIAACDPDTIRELLAERDQLAAALEAAREERDELAKDAAKYRWGINNARWIRSEQEAYVAIPVAPDADLSCVAMRDAAIDQARGKGGGEVGP